MILVVKSKTRMPFSRALVAITCAYAFTCNAATETKSVQKTVAIETEKNNVVDADVLFGQARDAMLQNDNRRALILLDQILRLPPNAVSQKAQELAGVVRERLQDIAKAKQEYELYLRLYPNGEDADRVRQRLASLVNTPQEPIRSRRNKTDDVELTQFNGMFYQYYYLGMSKTKQTPLNFEATPLDILTRTQNDQSSLISDISLNGRYRKGDTEHRLVFRNSFMNDFRTMQNLSEFDKAKSKQRLSNAYYDYRNRSNASSLRLGRQPAGNTGIFGRFDGINASTDIVSQWRVGAVGGVINNYLNEVQPSFYGMNTEVNLFDRKWSANTYYIEQTIQTLPDRRAVGLELRYFEGERSLFVTVDYDFLFEKTNAVLSNGSIAIGNGLQYNFSGEYRRLPFLQTSNAFLTQNEDTASRFFSSRNPQALRAMALRVTSASYDLMNGFTYKFASKWQVGLEGRVTRITSIQGEGIIAASEGTGNIYSATSSLIGSSIFDLQDSTVFNLTGYYGLHGRGLTAAFIERFRLFNRWTIESIVRYDYLINVETVKRISPIGKILYRWQESVEFQIEGGIENSQNYGVEEADKVDRVFGSVGYQWFF